MRLISSTNPNNGAEYTNRLINYKERWHQGTVIYNNLFLFKAIIIDRHSNVFAFYICSPIIASSLSGFKKRKIYCE